MWTFIAIINMTWVSTIPRDFQPQKFNVSKQTRTSWETCTQWSLSDTGRFHVGDASSSMDQHPHSWLPSFHSACEHVYNHCQLSLWSVTQVWNIHSLVIRDLWKQMILNIMTMNFDLYLSSKLFAGQQGNSQETALLGGCRTAWDP